MAALHPTTRVLSLVPKYVTRFSCIGPACEDTCCAGWRVEIDKKSFNAYREITHPDLKQRMKAKLHRSRQKSSNRNYGYIELPPETALCPFSEESLCAVQKLLGEDMLSNTCFNYPRHTTKLAGVTQQCLTLSCPEAARLALIPQDAFEFVEAGLHLRQDSVSLMQPKFGLSAEQMNEARFFALQLIRLPEFALWQKMAMLGIYCERLQELVTNKTPAALPEVIAGMQGAVDSGLIADALAQLGPDHHLQAMVFGNLWKLRQITGGSAVQKRQMAFILQGLGICAGSWESAIDELPSIYQEGLIKLGDALRDHPWLLENYLVNEMFRETFPFNGDSPARQYFQLVTRYGVLRWMLAIRCMATPELPSPNELVETIQTFCRLFQHNAVFASLVDNALENTGWNDLNKIARFLRS